MKDQSKTKQLLIQELASLRQKVAEFEQLESLSRKAEERLSAVNECLLSLGIDVLDNIRRLTVLAGELMGATASIYNRLEGDMLVAVGQWQTPTDFKTKNRAQGRLCYNVIRTNEERIIHIRNLAASPYAETDPNVCAYGLATYIGHVVRWGSEPVGSLCVVFQRDFIPTADDERLLGIVASSIGAEENRWRNEDALQESEEKHRLFFEHSADIIYTIDLDYKILSVSPSVEHWLGYKPEEFIGRSVGEINILPFEYFDQAYKDISSVFSGNKIFASEYVFIARDGSRRVGEISGAPLIKDGTVTGLISVARDITDRKLAEEALRESGKRFRMIVDNARDVIWMLDMNHQFTFMSSAIEQMLGYTVEEYLAKPHSEILVPASLDLLLKIFAEELALANDPKRDLYGSRTVETEQIHKNGSRLWVELKMNFILDADGKPVGILGFSRDITERKQAEKALRESEQRIRLALEGTDQGLWDLDLVTGKGKITYSDNWHKILGYGPEESSFGYEWWTNQIHPESRPSFDKALLDYMSGHTKYLEYEYQIRDKSGEWKWVHALGIFTETDKTGFPVRMSGTLRDITDRKRAEEERLELERRLQHAQKMEAIGTLAGGIAHDFNNLLMGIQGYTSLMLLDIDPSHPHYERLKRMEQMVASGADLTKQLLGFARRGRYEVKPTDMNDVLEKSSSMFGRTKKEISIHRKYAKDLWSVEVDRGQMEQVFMSLYVNAWQAMPGGGEIYLETEKIILDDEQALPYAVKPGRYIKISMTDTGTGMDEKTRERIFDPFFTTKKMGRGTGLGLATVYGIIKGHGGMINVDGEPGQGTTFTIYLPASEKEAVKERTATGTIARGTETILLVDDEKMVMEVSKELLESMGYRVYAAGNGQEAMAVYLEKRNEIDLVILDMILPGISGGETFDRLREIDPDIRVLLSSGYSIEGQAQQILKRGCNGFIQKPFQLENLSQKVREMLD